MPQKSKRSQNPKSERSGYGSFVIDNENTVLCSDVNSNLCGHNSILNLLKNEFDDWVLEKKLAKKTSRKLLILLEIFKEMNVVLFMPKHHHYLSLLIY